MTDTPTTLVCTEEDIELPAPGTFTIDPTHSVVGFSVRHIMISRVKGRFADFTATLDVPENPLESTLEVEVALASVDTRDADRDGHLRSPDFFDVENFPTMTYRSLAIRQDVPGSDNFQVKGQLSVHGITRPLILDVNFDGVGTDPAGGQRLGFNALGEINREEFGLTWNQALESGGVLVGKQVRLEIEAEFVRQ